jgi:hypothetical protein
MSRGPQFLAEITPLNAITTIFAIGGMVVIAFSLDPSQGLETHTCAEAVEGLGDQGLGMGVQV